MWPNPQETADLVILTEEILNEKLHFLCCRYSTLHVSLGYEWNLDQWKFYFAKAHEYEKMINLKGYYLEQLR